MKSTPKRVAVGVGVTLGAVLLWLVASKPAPPPSPLRVTFIGFEPLLDGKIASFVITNTLPTVVGISNCRKLVQNGTKWETDWKAKVWFEDWSVTTDFFHIQPGSNRKILVRVSPSESPWRLGVFTSQEGSLVKQIPIRIRRAWETKDFHQLLKKSPIPDGGSYSDPIVN